jgi:hypothetical protein
MSTTSGLAPADRGRCATMSRWLGASPVLGTLALCCTVATVIGSMAGEWRGATMGLALLVLALTPFERYLALRIRFDAGLFADLADGRIADLAALDAGLGILGARKAAQSIRTLDDRLQGARRLWRFHAIVAALMATATAVAVVFARFTANIAA